MASLMDMRMRGLTAFAVDDSGVYYNHHDRAIVLDVNEEWGGYSFTDGLGDQIWCYLVNTHSVAAIDAWITALPKASWVIENHEIVAKPVDTGILMDLDLALQTPPTKPMVVAKKCNDIYRDSRPLSSMMGKLDGLNEAEQRLRHEISMAPSKFSRRATTSWPTCVLDSYVQWRIEAVKEIGNSGDFAKITFGCPKCYPGEFI